MKKFAKMLALGLALAMTFGMVVSAAENPSVVAKDPIVQEPAGVDVKGAVTDTNVTDEEKAEVVEKVNAVVANPTGGVLPGAWLKIGKVLGTFFWTAADGPVVLDVSNEPALASNENYAFLHVTKDGVKYINLKKPVDGKLTADLDSFSPYTLVVTVYNPPVNTGDNGTSTPAAADNNGAPTSPKTGETLPVAGMMAVLFLAGAVICAKKARCNN